MATATQQSSVLMHEEMELENGCGCFQSICFGGKRRVSSDDDRWNLLSSERRERKESWVVTHLKKLKEASELVAGPKWKNFIRKIGGYFNSKNKRTDFQYDSFNYTLNFDDGMHVHGDDNGALGFSSRFAPPVIDKPRSST